MFREIKTAYTNYIQYIGRATTLMAQLVSLRTWGSSPSDSIAVISFIKLLHQYYRIHMKQEFGIMRGQCISQSCSQTCPALTTKSMVLTWVGVVHLLLLLLGVECNVIVQRWPVM